MENYSFIRVVGKGSYGEVNLVKHRTEGKQYVIKKLNLCTSSKRERKAAEQEAQLLSQLKHPNIVTYRESWEGEDCQLYIAMGFCEGGDLYHKLKEQKGKLLAESQVVEWFVQIAMALQYLHEKNILHRDLKTQNIFLTRTNIIKVGDLGIARVLENQNDMASTLIGTPYYMSPELFSNKPYNHKSDVWALGCCAYEMATLKHAFNAKDMNSLVYRIVEGKLPPMPKDYNPLLGELIRRMLSKKPEDRPAVKHILRQPYIKRQISVFLEATKVKTAKSRKKILNSRPNNSPSVSSNVPVKQENAFPWKPSDANKNNKGDEEKHLRKIKESDTALEILSPPHSLGENIPNGTGTSLATISKVDIDVCPNTERKDKGDYLTHGQEPGGLSGVSNSEDLTGLPVSNGSEAQDYQLRHGSKLATRTRTQLGKLTDLEDMGDMDDTMKLLHGIPTKKPLPELNVRKESLDSTEKLLEPFVPVPASDDPPQEAPPPPDKDCPRLQPSSSSSEPSVSRLRRQRHMDKAEENEDRFKMVPRRPLPSPPRNVNQVAVKKSRSNQEIQHSGISKSLCNSKDSETAASQERPLSARERRRLKQSQEDFCSPAVPEARRASHSVVLDAKTQSKNLHVAISRSSSDLASHIEKHIGAAQRFSDEDEYSSSTSSTDRSEGEGREGKNDSSEMQDLVQLMTQTLRMDSRDPHDMGPHVAPPLIPEFKLNRKYRDTLILHGKAKEEQEDFQFSEFPSDTSVTAKIRRTIESVRTNAVKGLGVALLDKVLEIMEEDDEHRRELCLREHMGEHKYREYAVMVRQLKFFEDVALKV
ncbi:serine/threonine-protein kinase Nek4-like isoform X2 [Polyodon spathula]|uniref:serine/threonine-protein kinase Nek4-like isoform X2 n=1 Tax=Polyodon spathula TaxID=7913 RepID=UPI001B7EE8AF|nr:serine/threonine-protein kinase Nek4-like isoform X2 [Polyodon spathula]